jgi:hypothetical protein
MGYIEALRRQSVTYLVAIGYSEPIADQLYNGHHHCKEIFACMLLVTLYGFFMTFPSETGSQRLRGIRAAVLLFDGVPANPRADNDQIQPLNTGPPDGRLDATVRALIGLVTNLVSQVGDLRQELAVISPIANVLRPTAGAFQS